MWGSMQSRILCRYVDASAVEDADGGRNYVQGHPLSPQILIKSLHDTCVERKLFSGGVQVLGVSKKIAGDEELANVIEQAHSSIMMEQLKMRMKGQTTVSQDIAYADKAVYLPWRPRWCLADRKLMWISLAIQLALLLYSVAVGQMTGTQPVLASCIACAAIVYFKLEKLFPSGAGVAFSADANERKQGGKNLLRAVAVALMGTASGIVFFFTLPDLISNSILHKPLPFWMYDFQDTVLTAGAVFMNLILSIFFR